MEAGFIIDHEAEIRELEKYANFVYLMDGWLNLLEENKRLSAFFLKMGYDSIAVYGMGVLGKHLYRQLISENSKVTFTIDRDTICFPNYENFNIYDIPHDFEMPDVIVVTPVGEFRLIKQKLESIFSSRIVSLEEVIMSI